MLKKSLDDIRVSGSKSALILMLGWLDVKQRYRRSTLGPFWLTISMGVMIAIIGTVFGAIFRAPIDEFLPFLAAGLILWTFISTQLTESCTVFTVSEHIIKQLPLPLMVHVARLTWRNAIIMLHNIAILPVVYICFGLEPGFNFLYVIPGLAILILNLGWVSLFLGVICTRFRDFPQIVVSLLQVAFYLTPIIWMPSLLPERGSFFLLDLNPLYHVMQVVRAPLLFQTPDALNWLVSIGLALFGWLVTLLLYDRYRGRVAYWL